MLYDGRFDGGCFCGSIRFRFHDVYDSGYCHCSICRRSSGAALMAFANTPSDNFALTQGAPSFVATSAEFERGFCPACGTVMFSRSIDPARWAFVSVHLGAVDRAAEIAPAVHICAADRLPWLHLDDVLPRVDDARPPPPAQRGDPRWKE